MSHFVYFLEKKLESQWECYRNRRESERERERINMVLNAKKGHVKLEGKCDVNELRQPRQDEKN